ncbi:phage baseplate plug family protein [Shinella granuli]|uniref:Cyanophage baseplate Pam3 plug gp18 domain-containing protein n=1 Tax=Shinella granuli TaxID=323621 RepID=A0A4V2RHR5_SHIGR|nr:hypothetical protein [Shinella granuli]TCN41430.1 hypothetical protein EV665_11315 [Shinella granuli]
MASLYEIPVLDAPRQVFSTIINGRKVTIRMRYSSMAQRYSMDLSIDETTVLTGRKMVANVDLLEPFDLGIGKLFVVGPKDHTVIPTMEAFAAGQVKLYSYV